MASFVLANANGLHETQLFPDKPRRFFQHLLNVNADFAFITETHFTPYTSKENAGWDLELSLATHEPPKVGICENTLLQC